MRKNSSVPQHHGYGEVGVSRYFALYLTMAGWTALGFYLMSHAYWPSTCQPETLIQVYKCSSRLGDGRGWIESALMTWLWSTPLLVALEVMRHKDRLRRR